ncbi:hypothetical protein BH10PSE19_BH10PSE19_15770 [soil metagenome]
MLSLPIPPSHSASGGEGKEETKSAIVRTEACPHIIYHIPGEVERKITVVDGVPFYQSSGLNSKLPGAWLPFMLAKGIKVVHFKTVPTGYNKKVITAYFNSTESPYTMLKLTRLVVDTIDFPPRVGSDGQYIELDCRMVRKCDYITATRLASGVPPDLGREISLTPEQNAQMAEPLLLETKPQFTTDHPDKLNAWLTAQGAAVACHALLHNFHSYATAIEGEQYLTLAQCSQIETRYSKMKQDKWYPTMIAKWRASDESTMLLNMFQCARDDRMRYILAQDFIYRHPTKDLTRCLLLRDGAGAPPQDERKGAFLSPTKL